MGVIKFISLFLNKKFMVKRDKEFFIQHAIKHKGSLKKWLKEHYGKRAFKHNGTIKISFLKKIRKNKNIPLRIKRKINLAITLHKLRKK